MKNVDRNSLAYWYDDIYPNGQNDCQFYMRHLSEDDLALEVGCGTGQVYLEVINSDYRVHGIDISGNMLNKLRKKLKVVA
jgi:ubiquinone/menaquinone biosynthesis C-methylase UbiE